MNNLEGKAVLITGAGSGIGRAAVRLFARAGANLILAGRRPEPLEEACREAETEGASAVSRSVDLEDGNAAAALGQWALDTYGHVEVLVNNAGHSTRVRNLRYLEPSDFASVFKVNVEGVYRLTQSLIGSMIERESGTVVSIASMAAVSPGLIGGAAYGAAKAGEAAMMRALNAEVRRHGVRSCIIFPGEADTPILDQRPMPPDAAARATMMQPEDVAEAIFLCASMPQRTLVEQIIMMPTRTRDQTEELENARKPPRAG